MVRFHSNIERGKLEIKVLGESPDYTWQDVCEFLKNIGGNYNGSKKFYDFPLSEYENLEKELYLQHIIVETSELEKRNYEYYKTHLSELRYQRVIANWRLMKFPPLKGKAPYENYQSDDCFRALSQNRFLFNWEMGLGKSAALTFLIENLRAAGKIGKCIICTTGVGVYNLKGELLKFGRNIREDEIFVVGSVAGLEDRNIFDAVKYPYNILIMTYDTFTNINNHYFDLDEAPKTIDRQIEKAEQALKDITAERREWFKLQDTYAKETDVPVRRKKLEVFLREDSAIKSAKRKLSEVREKKYPSRKRSYRTTHLPLEQWKGDKPAALFLDECHSLADPGSQRSNSFIINIHFFEYRYLFTGTFADKYEKLYMPLKILDRDLVGDKNFTDWLREYNDVGNGFSDKAVNPEGWKYDKLNELNELLLKKYASKREMTKCLNLPPNLDVPTVYIDMSPVQRDLYQSFVKEEVRLQNEAVANSDGNVSVKDKLINMFQVFSIACENPECIIDSPMFDKFTPELQKKIESFDFIRDSSKIGVLQSVLDEEVDSLGNRGIIWYYHPKTKEALEKYLKKYNPIVVDAGCGTEEMSRRIAEFKADDSHKLLIASINVMNTSVTVTEATFAFYMERTYNYTIWAQSRGRIFRPGQKNVTKQYTVCYKSSIDNLQLKNLKSKGRIVDGLLSTKILPPDTWKKVFNCNEDTDFGISMPSDEDDIQF